MNYPIRCLEKIHAGTFWFPTNSPEERQRVVGLSSAAEGDSTLRCFGSPIFHLDGDEITYHNLNIQENNTCS